MPFKNNGYLIPSTSQTLILCLKRFFKRCTFRGVFRTQLDVYDEAFRENG